MAILTEYFKFDDVEPVLRDLRQMKPKVLEQVELDILFGSSKLPAHSGSSTHGSISFIELIY